MKFLFPLALLAVGAVAQTTTAATPKASSECDADYIVSNCLESETDKVRGPRPTIRTRRLGNGVK